VAVLQDLSGPKIRTGALADGKPLQLSPGDVLTIEAGDFAGERRADAAARISTTYAPLVRSVRPGDALLLDDGRIQLRVEETTGSAMRTSVVHGGTLGERKGINAPGVALPSDGLTTKDADDLRFGVEAGVDWMALSFVQSARDLQHARDALRAAGAPHLPLVAKLERPQAIDRLDDILRVADAVMVARGDLGLELPLERVPRVQKEVTRRARFLGVPVIVATQVLESMRTEPRPTRAEVSDAANAVDDGVDGIMLAGETAVGAYPVQAVRTLDLIVRDAESLPAALAVAPEEMTLLSGHGRAICEAAVTLAERGHAEAVLAVTRGGKTARVLSALRPAVPIFAMTDHAEVARRLAVHWGVTPLVTEVGSDATAAARRMGEALAARGTIARGAAIVLVSVTPDLAPGPSNFVRVQTV
jgi:pyruvate kinase